MTQYRFQFIKFTLLFLTLIGFFSASFSTFVLAQEPTQTPAPTNGLFITVITDEPQINVRLGPSSTVYPIVGTLLKGATAPALGRSQGGDWIQIEFPSAPDGVGWVYSPLVQVSPPGNLIIVPPPPTPLGPATSTVDPTLAAQFVVEPTSTRLPTFTPQPSMTPLPTFTSNSTVINESVPLVTIIIAFAILGFIGFLLSFIRR
ncbi:MAG TPA: SH3 domain-containing protein [Anaerolineales bacterium]|nr:SH3 domain-containing protein [Anaerolineales bacterium]